jgi:hypothetical protein
MAEATIGCRDRPRRSVRLFALFSLACRGSCLVSKKRAAGGSRPSPAQHYCWRGNLHESSIGEGGVS